MALVTLRVLEGADRGRAYEQLPTPVTIGREEGNSVQLNDERVSRFHLKIQEDGEKLVLTDLESTNGTKVNGEDIQLRILRFGDTINVGRSRLLYGSPEQIAQRLAEVRNAKKKSDRRSGTVGPNEEPAGAQPDLEFELHWSQDPDAQATLLGLHPPELPERLTPGQSAQLSEFIEYFHYRLRDLLESVQRTDHQQAIVLEDRQWQNLLDMQSRLAQYLRDIARPDQS
jgi:pSer/pThr/pTyr-binding forkhead associated (FHA) protein